MTTKFLSHSNTLKYLRRYCVKHSLSNFSLFNTNIDPNRVFWNTVYVKVARIQNVFKSSCMLSTFHNSTGTISNPVSHPYLDFQCYHCNFKEFINVNQFKKITKSNLNLLLHCKVCKSLYSKDSIRCYKENANTIYEIFDLGLPHYDICKHHLKKKYLELQSHYHPDKVLYQKKDYEILCSYISSLLVEYYNILQDPCERAYLLLKYFLPSQEYHGQLESIVDPNLLFNIIEYEEKIIETQSIEEENQLLEEIQKLKDKYFKILSQSFLKKDYVEAIQNFHYLKLYSELDKKLSNILCLKKLQ